MVVNECARRGDHGSQAETGWSTCAFQVVGSLEPPGCESETGAGTAAATLRRRASAA